MFGIHGTRTSSTRHYCNSPSFARETDVAFTVIRSSLFPILQMTEIRTFVSCGPTKIIDVPDKNL